MEERLPELRVGTAGYQYRDWKGSFYPEGLPGAERLGFYAEHFSSVELNSTFYGLPGREAVRRWRDAVPGDFRFAVKISRYGTHMKRLRDPRDWIDRFETAIAPLGPTLGPILVQLPPRWHRDPERLTAFFDAIPAQWRVAVEVRDPDWLDRSVYRVLQDHDAALTIHDLLEDHPRVVTAGWVYLRFHGPHAGRPYAGSYSHRALSGAARRIRGHLDAGRDTYAYFNNDAGADAVHDALALKRYLHQSD